MTRHGYDSQRVLHLTETITESQTFLWRSFGTVIPIFLGNGVYAVIDPRTTRAANAGWLGIVLGWDLAVFADVSVTGISDGHLDPAAIVALAFSGIVGWSLVPYYVTDQLLDASVGVTLTQVTLKQLFDIDGVDNSGNPTNANTETGGNSSTAPLHPNNFWNAVTELLATFVLLSSILLGPIGGKLDLLKYFGVSFATVSIGLSLDPPTGYATNPVRSLGLHLACAFVLPTEGKGGANWSYIWVLVAAPILAAVVTGALALVT